MAVPMCQARGQGLRGMAFRTNFKQDMTTIKTSKRRRKEKKTANIVSVRDQVEALDGEQCRIGRLLARFGFSRTPTRLELAHVEGRKMGGNPDLSRDTVENTLLTAWDLHNGGRHSMHGGLVKVEPMTEKGTRGPIAVTFYEQLPSEIR